MVPEYVLDFVLNDVVLPLSLAMMAWAAASASSWLRARVKNERARGALERAVHVVDVAVRSTQQVLVDRLKAAATDGTLTEEDAKRALRAALESAKSHLGEKGIAELREVIGTTNDTNVVAYLESLIEARVAEIKAKKE
jgi:hypothetical protein